MTSFSFIKVAIVNKLKIKQYSKIVILFESNYFLHLFLLFNILDFCLLVVYFGFFLYDLSVP